jgi:nucleoside-diphosphate-sugar epimerase
MTAKKTILVTGMSGLIGGLVGRHLAQRYTVRALNRRSVQGVETVCADITDLAAIRPAFEQVDVVVHMAASLAGQDEPMLAININGTYNVFEAARQAGVKRIVFASSGAVMGGYGVEEPYRSILAGDYTKAPAQWRLLRHDDPIRPNGIYAVSKAAGEAMGRSYADTHGLSVICLRLGRVEVENRPLNASHVVVFLTHRDCVQLVECAVEAPEDLRFDIFFGTSDNKWGIRDLEYARQVIGYKPQDRLGDWP